MISFNDFDLASVDQEIRKQRDGIIKGWQSAIDKTLDDELKSFFDHRFGQNCWTSSFVKNRGEVLYYRACDKTEFVFDEKIVFSLLIKTDTANPCIEVIRYYKEESE
ncbi:hypothetical protein Q4503_16375 [Colwellia sp. 6_MG-2023]|uniref:hypothetical protein n=1 Tax=Colwellia sp. 6_MG-2023 TaxID=3062676 RepID=UPI0026E32D00|nr:hypothetical protein [Colwellia sp. 6_MG-2023]MDO6489272.1 hypothetical protein [Colwellia sp. 6_MG-2023]